MVDRIRLSVDKRSASSLIARLIAKADDVDEALDAVGFAVSENVRLCFLSSRDPWGRPWPGLKSRAGQPLRDRGTFLNGISHRTNKDSVDVGSAFKWAATHQFGATITPKTAKWLRFKVGGRVVFTKKSVIPARPFLPISRGRLNLPRDWRDDVIDTLMAKFTEK